MTTTLSPAQADGYYVEGELEAPHTIDGITITPMRQVFASEQACAEYHRLDRMVAMADELVAQGLATSATLYQRRRVIAARERAARLDWTPAQAFQA